MTLRQDMPTRQEPRAGSGDERHAATYDAERGGWYAGQPPVPSGAGQAGAETRRRTLDR